MAGPPGSLLETPLGVSGRDHPASSPAHASRAPKDLQRSFQLALAVVWLWDAVPQIQRRALFVASSPRRRPVGRDGSCGRTSHRRRSCATMGLRQRSPWLARPGPDDERGARARREAMAATPRYGNPRCTCDDCRCVDCQRGAGAARLGELERRARRFSGAPRARRSGSGRSPTSFRGTPIRPWPRSSTGSPGRGRSASSQTGSSTVTPRRRPWPPTPPGRCVRRSTRPRSGRGPRGVRRRLA